MIRILERVPTFDVWDGDKYLGHVTDMGRGYGWCGYACVSSVLKAKSLGGPFPNKQAAISRVLAEHGIDPKESLEAEHSRMAEDDADLHA